MRQPQTYSAISIFLHWAIFLLLAANVAIGWGFEHTPKDQIESAMQLHKGIGFTILFLVVLRIIFRIITPAPRLPSQMTKAEIGITHLVHFGLYLIMLGVPIIGYIMVSASGKYPASFFTFFNVPLLPISNMPYSDSLHEITEFAHSKLVWVGIVLVALHVAAALKHQFVTKDNLMSRMIPFLR